MRFTTKTEYGLVCLCYMARKPAHQIFTINEIVKNEQMSTAYIEKIFQQLRASDIVVAQHGKQGGYSLARHPSKITLKEIVEALEGQTFDIYCAPELRAEIVCTHFPACGVRPVWRKTKEVLDHFYETLTLEMVARDEEEMESQLFQKTSS